MSKVSACESSAQTIIGFVDKSKVEMEASCKTLVKSGKLLIHMIA